MSKFFEGGDDYESGSDKEEKDLLEEVKEKRRQIA